MDQYR